MAIRRRTLIFVLVVLAAMVAQAPAALGVTCPSPNPVVNENGCQGAGTTAWRLTRYDTNGVAGFATQPSVNVGSSVTLKIGRFGPQNATVDIFVYRIGYYGGTGGRLVHSAGGVAVNNPFACGSPDATTGHVACDAWDPTYTIPASALTTSGVYLVRLRATDTGNENHVLFVVRDDGRRADVLYKLPNASYQAYNNWGNKSLYDFNSLGATTISGGPRAAKVSFRRPLADVGRGDNWFMKSDFAMVSWMEKQGYDVSYTEDVSVSQSPGQLLGHRVDMIAGHDEYWTAEEMHGYKAARDAGVSVASFSGNSAYWKTRLEDGGATLVDYKTVQGSGANGAAGENDWGPDGVRGTADDALGADGRAGTADDRPQNATTTWRDNGALPGDPTAPAAGRVGPDEPENSLLGSLYVGDNDSVNYPLTVPAANAAGEYGGDRVWRNTTVSSTSSTTIGTSLTGWEWDAVPANPQYAAQQPAGVVRLSSSDVTSAGSAWLQDEGRLYGGAPPAGQPGVVQMVKYRAPSGALVFSAGTNLWSWGLGPHWIDQPGTGQTFQDPPVDSSDPRIAQVTYNVFSDMGVQPATPTGITLDSGNQPPTAALTASPNPALAGQTVTFDASGSSDVDGSIASYEWDLDGNGSYETTTTTPTTTRAYSAAGPVTVGLRVTDNQGATGTTTRTISISSGQVGPYATAVRATSGLAHYWRLGEMSGSTLIDSVGSANATQTGATLGVAGALAGDSDTAVRFNGSSASASAPVNLSSTSRVTIELWLKWNAYANDDKVALELTPNFNDVAGGFMVGPNAPQNGGTFGVGIGQGSSRNNVFFARPSAGVWHHYAFVLDSTASAATQITPYVDGVVVPYAKTASGTGAGPFANSSLSLMARNGTALLGAGDLDELALYTTALSAATIRGHFNNGSQAGAANRPPTASFTATPTAPLTGQTVTFDASASSDPDGLIANYAWDLDGNGSYETDTGTTPTATKAYASAGAVTVGLKVTDNEAAAATATRTVTVLGTQPGDYAQQVLATNGLAHYWRLDEPAGATQLDDSAGSADATTGGGITLGVAGALAGGSGTAGRFDGIDGRAAAPVNLSTTSQVTIELWLRWGAYANDDRMALELTPNFNQVAGGFAVDPNDATGSFAVGLGHDDLRNNVFFARPSAGVWHHYAFVLDSTALGATQITPYVDGVAVPYTKLSSGTGAGPFANSVLNVMSRSGNALFGAGDLDELALYTTALSASTIAAHFAAGSTAPPPPPPSSPTTARMTATPNPATVGQQVAFDGSASTAASGALTAYAWDLDGNGSFETDTGTTPIAVRSYASAGSLTVRLRVTDGTGATATTSLPLTVTAPAGTAAGPPAPQSPTTPQPPAASDTATAPTDASGLDQPPATTAPAPALAPPASAPAGPTILTLTLSRAGRVGGAGVQPRGGPATRLFSGDVLMGRLRAAPAVRPGTRAVIRLERSICSGQRCRWVAVRTLRPSLTRGVSASFTVVTRQTGMLRVSARVTVGGTTVRSGFAYALVRSPGR